VPAISEIAHKIDELSSNYVIGDLQGIRKKLKSGTRKAGSTIFREETIDDDEGWAYHFGGRTELQFNIGEEKEGLRYGIAFSLEPSQTLPDIELLFPKITRFNQFIRENPGFFKDYRMWHWQKGRSDIYSVKEISANLLTSDTFIFIGKLNVGDGINYTEILKTFDELLTPYIYVEKCSASGIIESEWQEAEEFEFRSGKRNLVYKRTHSTKEKFADLDVRHSLIQEKLAAKLVAEYGEDNVSIENTCFGKSIDVVLRQGTEYTFYEVKTCGSAKACIREALGQIMEYAYWPGRCHAAKIVIVGEHDVDSRTQSYLNYLKSEFRLPIGYEKVAI